MGKKFVKTPPTKMSHPIISQNMRFYKRISVPFPGVDNTSHSCIFCLHLLATNPEEQEQLHKHLLSSSKQVPRCWASSSFNENINWCVPQICSRKQKGTWRQLSEKVWGFKWVSWRQDHLWLSPTTTNRFLLLCTITSSANIRPTKCLFYGSSHFNISATKPWEHQAAGRSD